MQTFLDKLSGYIYENYSDKLDEICIIVPNRRASLFLKKGLADQAKRTIWSPQIFSIEDFINKYAGFNLIDPIYLQCELYNVHVEKEKGAAQSFAEFLKWGQVLLNDFNEIDMYLVDSEQLFSYLTESKALSLWNPDQTNLTDFQVKYLQFYNSLKDYHQMLGDNLMKKKQVYPGLAYRYLAENIESKFDEFKYYKIIFAGFNALTKAEEKIITFLEKAGLAEIIWDADAYYINDKVQEAGKFIRSYQHKFNTGEIKWIGNYLNTDPKEINLIGVPQQVGQAKVAGQILQEFSEKNDDLRETAVVLNDESLIEPLLNSIPESINEYNLTMGLSLKNSVMFRFIKLIIDLHVNALKFNRQPNSEIQFYHRDVLNILEHPYIQLILKEMSAEDMPQLILKSNKVFLDFDEILSPVYIANEPLKLLCNSLFKPWNDSSERALSTILEVIKTFKVFLTDPTVNLESHVPKSDLIVEYLFQFSKVFNKIKKLIVEYDYLDSVSVFKELFFNITQSINLPFYGEPLKGLQVMGMLETRNLDFNRLIMLSVNDDFIPSGSITNSFIPFEIKRDFKLPTHRERNAVFAYHFYRILQRSKQVYLLYNTESGELGGGDKSRFILQMQNELVKSNPAIKLKETILSVPVKKNFLEHSIVIQKTAPIMEILNSYLQKGCSASAINIYRNCSLQFYFRYILGLEESEKVEETIEASTLGTVIHDVLQKLYAPLKPSVIHEADIKSMISKVKSLITISFNENYQGGDVNFGKNLLIVKVANIFLQKFLKGEIKFLKELENDGNDLFIEEVEQNYQTNLILNKGNQPFEIRLKGIFDRVDKLGNTIRIIDYKTGKVNQWDLKFNDWEDLLKDPKLDKCFQLLFYSYIFSKSNTVNVSNIVPGILSFRNLKQGLINMGLPQKEDFSADTLDHFESILKKILLEMINPEIAFSQTPELDNCKYCSFKSICNRN